MARRKQQRRSITFTQPMRVRVQQPEVEILASVKHLDVNELARAARAEIELGYVKTNCCHQLIRAVVRKGMVTRLVVEPPSKRGGTRVSPELRRMLNAARRRASPRRQPGPLPMPVAPFLANAARFSIQTIWCFQICIFGWCIACCVNGDIWFCGKVTIDGTNLPYPE